MSSAGIKGGSTVVCASAGNHGRAVARVSRELGCRARVYMSNTAAGPRIAAIRGEGAEVISIDGTYDDAVARMREDAEKNGWIIVSDTAWPGYEETPLAIMAGYTHLMDEAREQWDRTPDVVIVQAGVGGLAGAVVSWLCHDAAEGGGAPLRICVDQASAAPLLASARAGRSTNSVGPIETIMAGLGCSEPSSVAVPIMNAGCHVFAAIEDDFARDAMRFLARHGVVAGPSGAAGAGALMATRHSGIVHSDATVMVIDTEGAIDRAEYDAIVR
jgi:diaminopropionate ammonia-lyase